MKLVGILAVGWLFICAFPCQTRGELIVIGVKGVICAIDDRGNLLDGGMSVGDPIAGSYAYDSHTPDNNPETTLGAYWQYEPTSGITLTSAGLTFETDPLNVEFLVAVGDNSYGDDHYLLRSYNNLPFSNGVPVFHISWQLDDDSCTALSSDALPLGPPILEDWEYDWGLRIELGPKGDTMVTADVTSVWLIPEPATVLLLGLGALALLRMRRRG